MSAVEKVLLIFVFMSEVIQSSNTSSLATTSSSIASTSLTQESLSFTNQVTAVTVGSMKQVIATSRQQNATTTEISPFSSPLQPSVPTSSVQTKSMDVSSNIVSSTTGVNLTKLSSVPIEETTAIFNSSMLALITSIGPSSTVCLSSTTEMTTTEISPFSSSMSTSVSASNAQAFTSPRDVSSIIVSSTTVGKSIESLTVPTSSIMLNTVRESLFTNQRNTPLPSNSTQALATSSESSSTIVPTILQTRTTTLLTSQMSVAILTSSTQTVNTLTEVSSMIGLSTTGIDTSKISSTANQISSVVPSSSMPALSTSFVSFPTELSSIKTQTAINVSIGSIQTDTISFKFSSVITSGTPQLSATNTPQFTKVNYSSIVLQTTGKLPVATEISTIAIKPTLIESASSSLFATTENTTSKELLSTSETSTTAPTRNTQSFTSSIDGFLTTAVITTALTSTKLFSVPKIASTVLPSSITSGMITSIKSPKITTHLATQMTSTCFSSQCLQPSASPSSTSLSSSISYLQKRNITARATFDGECDFIKDVLLKKLFLELFAVNLKDTLGYDIIVYYPENPITCGSVIVDFTVETILTHLELQSKINNAINSSKIQIPVGNFSLEAKSVEVFSPPATTITTQTTTTPLSTISPEKEKKSLVVLYITVFSVVGFVVIIIIGVTVVGCRRRSEKSGKFKLIKTVDNHELSSFKLLQRGKISINMYGEEPVLSDAAETDEGNEQANGKEYVLGNNLPKWDLPMLETNKSTSDKRGIVNQGMEYE